jgi:hypothetical protein
MVVAVPPPQMPTVLTAAVLVAAFLAADVLTAAVLAADVVKAAGLPAAGLAGTRLPAELRPLAEALRKHGFRIRLAPPPSRGSYGEFVLRSRTLWIAPLSFELGIGKQVFLHEATHAVQSCPHGVLTPVGWTLPLAPVVSREISGILATNYHHGNQVVEQEAFALQGQADASVRLLRALATRCPVKGGNQAANKAVSRKAGQAKAGGARAGGAK